MKAKLNIHKAKLNIHKAQLNIHKTAEVLQNIIELFKSGKVPEAIAIATFPSFDIPANHWSLMNRLLLYCSGARDARGYRQWEKIGRHVKKGAKAIYILAPMTTSHMRKRSFIATKRSLIPIKRGKPATEEERRDEGEYPWGKENPEDNPEEEKSPESPAENPGRQGNRIATTGFISVPVFPVEDTEGEPLAYQELPIPQPPLLELARKWGLSIKAVPGNNLFLGSYSPAKQAIELATAEEKVFFHELAHHAHKLVMGEIKTGQDWRQEIVAELSSQALCRLVGKSAEDTLGNSYRYIARYAKEAGITPVAACLKVVSDVEKVVNLILREDPQKLEGNEGSLQMPSSNKESQMPREKEEDLQNPERNAPKAELNVHKAELHLHTMLIQELPAEIKAKPMNNPQALYAMMKSILASEDEINRDKEHFWAIGLNTKLCVRYVELVSLGIIDQTLVTPREVFRRAIAEGAASLIVAHNHPSGDVSPSAQDKSTTEKLIESGKILNINVLDHIVFSAEGFHSMREDGTLFSA